MRFAFYGRVSTEDAQDPETSLGWQLRRARSLIDPVGGVIVTQFFDVGQSRSLPWTRRPEATRLLHALKDPERAFSAVVIGEPQRAFYGNQFSLTYPVLTYYGVDLWVPEVGGRVDPGSEAHDMVMTLFGVMSKGERVRVQIRVRSAMYDLAERTDRFLGGRPPYGYRLADAGPHPNVKGRRCCGSSKFPTVDHRNSPGVDRGGELGGEPNQRMVIASSSGRFCDWAGLITGWPVAGFTSGPTPFGWLRLGPDASASDSCRRRC